MTLRSTLGRIGTELIDDHPLLNSKRKMAITSAIPPINNFTATGWSDIARQAGAKVDKFLVDKGSGRSDRHGGVIVVLSLSFHHRTSAPQLSRFPSFMEKISYFGRCEAGASDEITCSVGVLRTGQVKMPRIP